VLLTKIFNRQRHGTKTKKESEGMSQALPNDECRTLYCCAPVVSISTKSGANENTIWGLRQNHPELVVQDCRREFGLTEPQCERLREILMERGVNKWLLARRQFIALKHDLKETITELQKSKQVDGRILRKTLLNVYGRMQNICKMPRWIEWPKQVHKDMKKNESLVIVRGRHC
jgi:hypothetical protein